MSKTSGHERHAEEWYVEPLWASELLFKHVLFDKALQIWDPAAGQGNILASAKAAGYATFGSDTVPRAEGIWRGDFLDHMLPSRRSNIVCNPPYRREAGPEQFIRRAIAIGVPKHAWFVQRDFPYSARRHRLFTEHPPAALYFMSSRPSCPPGDMLARGEIEQKGGSVDYMWIVWERGLTDARAHWLRR